VADYINGHAFKPTEWVSSGIPIIRIQNLNNEIAPYNYATQDFEDKYKVVNGDLLFAWSASLGAYIWKGKKAWLNQHIFKIIPKAFCDKSFLFYTLQKITAEIYAKTHGSGMVHVTKVKFESTEIPLPPLPEQHRIVAKIEELLSSLDKGVESLKTAQQQLKVYRQAVLKWAFEGKLTNKNMGEGELPKGWKWMKLAKLATDITDGDHIAPPKSVEGIPFITISNINKTTQKVNFSDTFKVSLEYYRKLKMNRKPQKGDVLYTVTGSFGIPAIVDYEKEFCFQRHIGLVRPSEIANQKWMFYVLQSSQVYNQAKATATGTAQLTVSLKSLRDFNIPYCPLPEQHLIVQEIESRLSVCDKIEQSIEHSLKQSEALRQSILKKAFEGKLVPQDPNDEPASVLLDRIRKERSETPSSQTKTRSRK
jgi:type I restriction enzyme S subunit